MIWIFQKVHERKCPLHRACSVIKVIKRRTDLGCSRDGKMSHLVETRLDK